MQTNPAGPSWCRSSHSLSRAGVFDYGYFVNNYGWMQGFSSTQLVVNAVCRANGNFDFSGGTPTINGSVYAAETICSYRRHRGLLTSRPTSGLTHIMLRMPAAAVGKRTMRRRMGPTAPRNGTSGRISSTIRTAATIMGPSQERWWVTPMAPGRTVGRYSPFTEKRSEYARSKQYQQSHKRVNELHRH